MQTEAYRVSRSARKKIETLFGEAKHIHSLVRLRLRGLSGARDEFLLNRHRPESQTPGNGRHEATATAPDSVTNAKEPNATFSIDHRPPQPIRSGGRHHSTRPEPDPKSRTRPDFFNSLS
jgi:hypothetical protein